MIQEFKTWPDLAEWLRVVGDRLDKEEALEFLYHLDNFKDALATFKVYCERRGYKLID